MGFAGATFTKPRRFSKRVSRRPCPLAVDSLPTAMTRGRAYLLHSCTMYGASPCHPRRGTVHVWRASHGLTFTNPLRISKRIPRRPCPFGVDSSPTGMTRGSSELRAECRRWARPLVIPEGELSTFGGQATGLRLPILRGLVNVGPTLYFKTS